MKLNMMDCDVKSKHRIDILNFAIMFQLLINFAYLSIVT